MLKRLELSGIDGLASVVAVAARLSATQCRVVHCPRIVGKRNLAEVVTSLTGSSGLELGVYRHIVSARVPPIPPDRSHKNPVWGRTGPYYILLLLATADS